MADGWRVERRRGDADALHHAPVPTPAVASMWICEPSRPALVLGSTQDASVADAVAVDEHGIDLVVRRSGGGAVLLDPRATTRVDLIVPSGHPLWDADVGRASHWVGDLWARALRSCGVEAIVHRGAMRRTEWSSRVCFAGLGPGEVIAPTGEKLVGVSQRRTREAARFQTVAYHRSASHSSASQRPASPGVADLLLLSSLERDALTAALAAGTGPIDVARPALIDALTAALPDSLSAVVAED